MKNMIITAVFMILSMTVLHAQVRIAPKAGANFADLMGTSENTKIYTGCYGGVMVQVPIQHGWNIQPEVFYSGQGAKIKGENSAEPKIDLHYINVPVMVNYTSRCGLFGETGPQVSYLAKAKIKNDGGSTSVTDNYHKADFSWALGIGYITPFHLGINARYNLGISDITKNDGNTVRNSVIQAGLFYRFSL